MDTNFSEIIGNSKIKKILTDSVQKNNILHSYMFVGTDGIGKKIFATEFAKMILCESDEKPCGKCKPCIEFNSNNNPDFFLIEPDKNSLKIDQIREMQKTILEKPINGSKKIYIINDSEKMTKEAQNCLLKTLEEPQDFIVIILICSNENEILPTVKSRCTKVFFDNISDTDIGNYMQMKNNAVNFSENMIRLCNGSIGRANEIAGKADVLEKIEIIVNSVTSVDELDFIKYSEIFYENKEDIYLLLDYVYVLLSQKINRANMMCCIESMNYVQKAKKKLQYSNNYDMCIDGMLMNMWSEFNEKNNRS